MHANILHTHAYNVGLPKVVFPSHTTLSRTFFCGGDLVCETQCCYRLLGTLRNALFGGVFQ